MPRKSVLAERPVGGVAQTNVIWRLGINLRSPETIRLRILDANIVPKSNWSALCCENWPI